MKSILLQKSVRKIVYQQSWLLIVTVAAILTAGCEKPTEPEKRPTMKLGPSLEVRNTTEADLIPKRHGVWGKVEQASPSVRQSIKPKVDKQKTKILADNIITVSSGGGFVETKDGGILVHPAAKHPTTVEFDVGAKLAWVSLHVWIGEIPKDMLSKKNFGTAGVTVWVDGKSLGRRMIDRRTNQSIQLNLADARILRVSVDSLDNDDSCDWCTIGLE